VLAGLSTAGLTLFSLGFVGFLAFGYVLSDSEPGRCGDVVESDFCGEFLVTLGEISEVSGFDVGLGVDVKNVISGD